MLGKARCESVGLGRGVLLARSVARCAWLLSLALGCWTTSTRADTGPFFEPAALDAHGFDLRITAAYADASRSDFSQPSFLIAQQLSSLHARSFTLQADLRLRITPALAVQGILPLTLRQLDAESGGLQVSRAQLLPGQAFSISGLGVADPTIAAAYRFLRTPPWGAYAELGSTFPFDDSPGSAVLPTRVPIGTGQHVMFVGLGGSLSGPWRVGVSQRVGLSPGEHATYLVRRVGAQSYTSGALTAHWQLRTQAAAEHALWGPLSAQLTAAWLARQWPELVESGGRTTRVTRARWGHDLTLGAALRLQLAEGHRIELRLEWPLSSSVASDPFFPMIMPARGVGVTWLIGG